MDSYNHLSFIKEDGSLNLIASPELNTEVFEKLGLVRNGEKQVLESDFVIYPTDYFCPKSINDGIIRQTENTHSIHHFDATWFSEAQQKEKLERWERKQKQAKKKARRAKLKSLSVKLLGEKLYKKIRK